MSKARQPPGSTPLEPPQARLKLVRLLAQSPACRNQRILNSRHSSKPAASDRRAANAWEIIQDLYQWLDEEIIFQHKTELYD